MAHRKNHKKVLLHGIKESGLPGGSRAFSFYSIPSLNRQIHQLITKSNEILHDDLPCFGVCLLFIGWRDACICRIALITLWPDSERRMGFLHSLGFSKTAFQAAGSCNFLACQLDKRVGVSRENLSSLSLVPTCL